MYKLDRIEVEGFWGRKTVKVDLLRDVTIFVGRNGSGKTNLMNLLMAALTVDLRLLMQLEFRSITLRASSGKRRKTIRVEKHDDPTQSFERVSFIISRKRFELPLYSADIDAERYIRRRPVLSDAYESLRATLAGMVRVSALTVHREALAPIPEDDFQVRRRRPQPPIDERLQDLLAKLMRFQLELTERADRESAAFLKDVLKSILYDPRFDTLGDSRDFSEDLSTKKDDLIRAYQELGVLDSEIAKRIQAHVEALESSATYLESAGQTGYREGLEVDQVMPLPLFRRTRHIINQSLQAEKAKADIYAPIRRFVEELRKYIDDKQIRMGPHGEIEVLAEGNPVSVSDLSSGEKQILVLLIETLLQREHEYVFMADEPELSLHVAWQARVISSVRALNPATQLILATHSPEIIGSWVNHVVDMKDITSG